MITSTTRTAARLLTVAALSCSGLALSVGAASASTCTPDPIADPNIGAYACFDAVIQDSDPSTPGAEVSTAYFVDVDVFGQARICIGRFIVGGQLYTSSPYVVPTIHADGLGARVC